MKIVLGISGSIASYRSPDFLKELQQLGHEVQVVLTPSAHHFVSPKVLETLSGRRIYGADGFAQENFSTDHIELARWADLFFVYGASADTLSRLARGTAADFLSLQLLAFSGPVVLAPAMNPTMWSHPAVEENVAAIKRYGYRLVGPINGRVACGETGVGHIASHEQMIGAIASTYGMHTGASAKPPVESSVESMAKPSLESTSDLPSGLPSGPVAPPAPQTASDRVWHGKRVLISAGPMRTAIDPMRFIQNRSSGETAFGMATALVARGAEVVVLLGTVGDAMRAQFEKANFAEVRHFDDARRYSDLLGEEFPRCDVFVSAAAVLDFATGYTTKKISREEIERGGRLDLMITTVPDFVRDMSEKRREGQVVVAFAAETGEVEEILTRARKKLAVKGADAIVANPLWPDVGAERPRTRFWVLDARAPETPWAIDEDTKLAATARLIDTLAETVFAAEAPLAPGAARAAPTPSP